ncbi:MAG: PQQ-binding-like beta-propeller repeat protein [Ignavibacteriaceae bacterium]
MYFNLIGNVAGRSMFKFILSAVILFISLFTTGCSRSVISIERAHNTEVYPMYGKIPAREFYYNGNISDSLVFKWQAEITGSTLASSVVAYGHYVFLNDLSGRVYCFDINTGKTAGQLKHKGAVYTAPVLENITLIYASAKSDENNSELVFYDFINAKAIAELDIAGRVLSHIIKIDDGVVFTTENGRIYKFNFTGYKMFEHPTKKVTHSSPAFNNNILVFGNDNGEITGFNIKDQKQLYSAKISKHLLSGIAISGNTAFVGDYKGVLYAVDINSGTIQWEYNTGKRIEMIPAFDDSNVYIGNLGGEFFAIDKLTGNLIWKSLTDGILNAPPLVANNLIVVPDLNRKIHFINKQDGSIRKTMEFGGRVKLTPVFFNNLLFIGYDDGILEAYEIIN